MDVGASVAILRDGQILLTKRRDVEVWALPGGGIEAGETVVAAAIREAHEETGLEVELTHLVGLYCLPDWDKGDHINVLFAARPVGGTLKPQPSEVLEQDFFDPDALPEPLLWWHGQRIQDAVRGVGGSAVWVQRVHWPFGSRQEAYKLLAQAGPDKQGLFLRYFSRPEPEPEDLEVPQVGWRQEQNQAYYPMPAFPTLLASSLEASRQFYVEGLGFQHVFSIPGPDGRPVVEHIRFARYADILLEQEAPGSALEAAPRGQGVRLTFSLPLAKRNGQEIADRARSMGAAVEGPVDRPWNARDVVVSDPDGYVLVFTEPLDLDKSMDQVLDDIAAGEALQ